MRSTGSGTRHAEALLAAALLFATDGIAAAEAPFELRLIGSRTIEHRLAFGGTPVGGLSGIDYDPGTDRVVLISDDRGGLAPPRFYTARVAVAPGRLDVDLLTVVTLEIPPTRRRIDPESIRFDPRSGGLWWVSEGEAGAADPFIGRASTDGRSASEVPLPAMFRFAAATGPRNGRAFEGAALSNDGASLWVAMEGPLKQDGPAPTPEDGAWSRFSRFDRAASAVDFGSIEAQYAYRIDPVPSDSVFGSRLTGNGVTEILAIGPGRLLVLERALVVGKGWRARLFVADAEGASDIRDLPALADGGFVPMQKQFVVDLDDFDLRVDNFEGLCFGPLLPNGNRTLLLVSDDNFNPGQTTRIVAFELLPR